jgi:hypothetical protein
VDRSRIFMTVLAVALGGCAQDRPDPGAGSESSGSQQQDATLAAPAKGVVEPEAAAILGKMSAFLAEAERLSFSTWQLIDEVEESGQKIQFGKSGSAVIERPNKLHAEYSGDLRDHAFWYDGKTITVMDTRERVFVRAAAPDTIDAMLDELARKHGVVVPMGELLHRSPAEAVMTDDTSGRKVGLHKVDGVECHHLAFTQSGVDWQIWIETGDKPFPRKVVITHKRQPSQPQHLMLIGDWKINPKIPRGSFDFKAPKDAQEISFYQPGEEPPPKAATPDGG